MLLKMPLGNTLEKYSWSMPLGNALGKRPLEILLGNALEKYSWSMPLENALKYPWKMPLGILCMGNVLEKNYQRTCQRNVF